MITRWNIKLILQNSLSFIRHFENNHKIISIIPIKPPILIVNLIVVSFTSSSKSIVSTNMQYYPLFIQISICYMTENYCLSGVILLCLKEDVVTLYTCVLGVERSVNHI